MKRRKKQRTWNVTFTGKHAVVIATVDALDEDDAIVLAVNELADYYDWDVEGFFAEAELLGDK
jgi:hypothetical protein